MLKGVDYMKKIIPWMLATAVIMLVFPWLAVTFIKGDTGWISAKAYQRRPEILKKAWSVGLFW